MEDMVFKWPHKDIKAESNGDEVGRAVSIAYSLGREVATPNEYRQINRSSNKELIENITKYSTIDKARAVIGIESKFISG